MRSFSSSFCTLLLASTLASLGCHAQLPPAGPVLAAGKLSPETARRVEILIRKRTKLPPDYVLSIGPRTHSEVPGFDQIMITFNAPTESSGRPVAFLISADGNTVGQFNKYDISQDPRTLVSGAGRPYRGGPETAPVEIVAFDDLECPYCAKMHAQLFPTLVDRYGKQVHIVYRDFPIPSHPWAMRAAVDTNCLAAQSTPGYWRVVDYIHAHAGDLGGSEKSIQKANDTLDQITLDEARREKVKTAEVEACIKKQDQTAIKSSLKMGDDLGVEATPVLFINGEKLEGAYPLADVFRMVDGALSAAGQTPPAPYVPPAAPAPSTKPGT